MNQYYDGRQYNNGQNNDRQNHSGRNNPGQNHSDHKEDLGDTLRNNPRLRGIDPLKLKIIMEIREQSKNKSMEELLPQIMKINQELNRRNMNFSKSESEVLLEVIEESLSPVERQKFNMIKGFIK